MKSPWVIGLTMFLALANGVAHAQNRLAFVVGNDAYQNVTPLQKAVNDARAVGQSLRQLGFRVTFGENLAWREYVEKFSTFENSIQPGDTAFLFYSGHASKSTGRTISFPSMRRKSPRNSRAC
jgi:uncharacterized caspase-like protein